VVDLYPEILTRFPREMSGGQKQRVSIMRAAMMDPAVMLLDEPMAALDPLIRSSLQSELKSIFLRLGKTVLLVTHDEDLIDEVATRIWHFEGNHEITDFKGVYSEYQTVLA